jgi:hypothetical protein
MNFNFFKKSEQKMQNAESEVKNAELENKKWAKSTGSNNGPPDLDYLAEQKNPEGLDRLICSNHELGDTEDLTCVGDTKQHCSPTEEEIAVRAYYLWEEAGCHGDSETFWFQAKKELESL